MPSDNVTEVQEVNVDNSQYNLNDANQDCDNQMVESNQEEEEPRDMSTSVGGERLDLIETEGMNGDTNIKNTHDNNERTDDTATVIG